MTKASDNAFPSILITEGTEPSAPAAGKQRMYIDSTTHVLMLTNSSGVESAVGGAGTSVATDAIWDAAGDLVQGTGANTGGKLSAGLAGQTLRSAGAAAANTWAYPPGYEFDYAQFTGDVNISATTSATANTVVTAGAVTYDGSTIIIINFFAPICYFDSTDRRITFVLYDGSTELGQPGHLWGKGDAADTRHPVNLSVRVTPSAASHTYSIRAYTAAGTQQISGASGASGNAYPGFIRQTKV